MTTNELSARLEQCGIPFDAALPEKLLRYHALLMDWNTRMDLTAVTDEDEMIDRHYVDSLMALKEPGLIPAKGRLIDVGTGAGFPGLPLALACPDLQVTLMDAQQKRLTFLQAVIDDLGVENVTLMHRRAEDGAKDAALREQFDVAVARAVAALPTLCEYCLPFVKVGGRFVALKGPDADREQEAARRAVGLLGGRVTAVTALTLPAEPVEGLEPMERRLLHIDKVRHTPPAYPRPSAKIAKAPL